MPKITVRNAEFYYELHGEGEPLVLISGYTADHLYWASVLPELAKHFQVLVFDNRAVGQTQDSEDSEKLPLSIQSMSDDTMALIHTLGLHKPHIVGQSMGGAIVQDIAVRYPDEINKIGIINSTAKWRLAAVHGLRSLHLSYKEDASFECRFEETLAWVFGEQFLQSSDNVASLKAALLANRFPQSVESQARQFAALEQFDGRAVLSQIKAPTWIAYGSEDIISLPYESKALAEGISGAQLVEFKGTAHASVSEASEEFLAAFKNFFMSPTLSYKRQ